MATFIQYGSRHMLDSVADAVNKVENAGLDVHTVMLVLNGQHGEFDLVIEATDDDIDDYRFEGVAYRTGGVTDLEEVAHR